jgi:hypothetical protein
MRKLANMIHKRAIKPPRKLVCNGIRSSGFGVDVGVGGIGEGVVVGVGVKVGVDVRIGNNKSSDGNGARVVVTVGLVVGVGVTDEVSVGVYVARGADVNVTTR